MLQVVYRYVDPGPAPGASSAVTSEVMRRTRRAGTAPELAVRRALHRRGLRYLVDVAPPGTNRRRRADVVFRGARIALFVDGCFWHSCPEHGRLPKANREWWRVKLHGVVVRDRDTDAQLTAAGWLVVRVWEHDDPDEAAVRVAALVTSRRPVRPPPA
jgi:DNA mismatch endonuclease (patch repair protein)